MTDMSDKPSYEQLQARILELEGEKRELQMGFLTMKLLAMEAERPLIELELRRLQSKV